MSVQSNGGSRRPPPSPPRTHINGQINGRPFRSSFYGGFVSRLLFRQGGTDHVLYDQQTDGPKYDCYPYVLPEPATKPHPRSLFEFWGPDGNHVAFEINDPDGTIDRIEVKLKKPGSRSSDRAVVGMQEDDGTIIIDEDSTICPPDCPEPG